MNSVKSKFMALFMSISAFLGSIVGSCGVACTVSGCCGSYALFGIIGLSSSSINYLEKLTPLFFSITVLSLAYAFYKAYKPQKNRCCGSELGNNSSEKIEKKNKSAFLQSKAFLWAVTLISAFLWMYPFLKTGFQQEYNKINVEKLSKNCCRIDSVNVSDCCSEKTDDTEN
ncbi:MAG: hypothetical protein N2449_09765 [Bacteroidales bacterium]|nr:hypothetical protein [Bacteroidales bacterium]